MRQPPVGRAVAVALEYTRINIRVSPKQWGNDREITVGVRGAVIAKLHSCSNAAVTRSSAASIDVGSAAHRSCPIHISAWKSCPSRWSLRASGTAVEMEALRLYHARLQTGNRSSTDFSCELRTAHAPVGHSTSSATRRGPAGAGSATADEPAAGATEPVRRPRGRRAPPPQPAARAAVILRCAGRRAFAAAAAPASATAAAEDPPPPPPEAAAAFAGAAAAAADSGPVRVAAATVAAREPADQQGCGCVGGRLDRDDCRVWAACSRRGRPRAARRLRRRRGRSTF